MGRVVIPGFRKIETGEGGSTTPTSYNSLTDKPKINGVELTGNLTSESIGIPEIADNLTTSKKGLALDASQGKVLNENQHTSLHAEYSVNKNLCSMFEGNMNSLTRIVPITNMLLYPGDYVFSFRIDGEYSGNFSIKALDPEYTDITADALTGATSQAYKSGLNTYTFSLNDYAFIGIVSEVAGIYIYNMQIEEGSTVTTYEEFVYSQWALTSRVTQALQAPNYYGQIETVNSNSGTSAKTSTYVTTEDCYLNISISATSAIQSNAAYGALIINGICIASVTSVETAQMQGITTLRIPAGTELTYILVGNGKQTVSLSKIPFII